MILTHSKIGLRSDKLRRDAQDSLYLSDREGIRDFACDHPKKLVSHWVGGLPILSGYIINTIMGAKFHVGSLLC